ncbi:MAG TPA: hypothetical protein VER58_04745 [Thermoanaerobaculia bacterium]|nr:hypothetical protein [Thermoanaerobaculia bacterium]
MIRKIVGAFLLVIATSAIAARPTPAPPTATASVAAAPVDDTDSRQTREEMKALLRRYPPELGKVLKLDPTLFNNETYLANYPALGTFVGQHPQVAHNPSYYLEQVSIGGEGDDPVSMRAWRLIMGDVAGFLVFLVVTSVLIWAVKTLIEQRRWSRLSRVQMEVNSKLLDRFTSNEELLAYIQTPAGKRFFESAPIPLEAGPRPISAPIGRIFWSLQAGLVMIALGIGFNLVSLRVKPPAAEGLYGIGIIGLMVGIALVISAIIFYVLSRRFGLWNGTGARPSES